MCSGDHGYIVYFSDVNTFWLVSGNKLLQLGDCVHVYNLGIQSKYSHMYMLHNGLSAYQCKVALLRVVGGAYNFQCFLFHCVPIVHCTGWPDSVVYSIKGKEGPTLAEYKNAISSRGSSVWLSSPVAAGVQCTA